MQNKSGVVFLILLLTAIRAFGQEWKDTVYYDENWSVCEQPVAEYYRVCNLNRVTSIFYKGKVTDYFITGQQEMTGEYDSSGFKTGHFIFYNAEGNKIREGNYVKDEMFGLWSFYDRKGALKVRFDCRDGKKFTPLLIINNQGDTILKNGNGKFSFNSVSDLPGIFPEAKNYFVTGEVVNGRKEGILTYLISINNFKDKFEEYYKNGKFIKAKETSNTLRNSGDSYNPYTFLNLESESLQKIDNFYHGNIEFGLSKIADKKMMQFLLQGEIPEIISEAKSYSEDVKDMYNIIGTVIRKSIVRPFMKNISYNYPPVVPNTNLLSFNMPADSSAQVITDTVDIEIDTAGYVSRTSFKGNLGMKEIKMMNFYLSRLSHLVPLENEGTKTNSKITIHLNTLVNNGREDSTGRTFKSYNYYALSGIRSDTVHIPQSSVDDIPKYAGGEIALKRFLERNLNSLVASDHNAPKGNYTVTVHFNVDTDGSVRDVFAVTNPGYGTAEEAVGAVNVFPKGSWLPAIKSGKKVIASSVLNFTFQVR